MAFLATTRFNSITWKENIEFREKYSYKGCIYGSPTQLSCKIERNDVLYVIEMNNSINKIEGIGLIKNKNNYDKYYRVYETRNFNRYTFTGKYRISRYELCTYNQDLVNLLECVLFKGKTHSKRGDSITLFPSKVLVKCNETINIKGEIINIFKEVFKK